MKNVFLSHIFLLQYCVQKCLVCTGPNIFTIKQFHRLLTTVRSTLLQLQQALKGEIVMSIEMEDAYESVHQVK